MVNGIHADAANSYLLQKRCPQKAVADFSAVLQHDPKNVAIRIFRARAYYRAQDYDRGIADCEEAIRIDPRCALAYAWRGTLYRSATVIV
jgi:Tfp pilus assembly protein PilF